jgi:ubiquinone/menaquinone biosynthesis C-methylase UbiE
MMVNLGDQYRYPTGPEGRLIAARMNRHHAKLTLWGLTKVTVKPDAKILDVGCGGGKTLYRLAKLTPHGKVFGIDYSSEMVNFSIEINKALIAQNRVEVLEGSVEKICFSDGFFDLVTAFETYYFWPNFSSALKEINRVLKPGGKLLLVNELKHGATSAKVIEETHVKLIRLQEIQAALQSAGFVDVQVFTEVESDWNAFAAQKQLNAALFL